MQVYTGGLFEHRLRFTQPEMAALLSGWDHLQSIGLRNYLPGMETALRHLRDELSGGGGGDLEEIGKRVRYQLAEPADEDLVPQVLRATEERRALRIRYFSVNSNSHRLRRVDPWHCVCRNGVWYLMGWTTRAASSAPSAWTASASWRCWRTPSQVPPPSTPGT
jgi:predicted DNA-binding transcriptional regulator YafY